MVHFGQVIDSSDHEEITVNHEEITGDHEEITVVKPVPPDLVRSSTPHSYLEMSSERPRMGISSKQVDDSSADEDITLAEPLPNSAELLPNMNTSPLKSNPQEGLEKQETQGPPVKAHIRPNPENQSQSTTPEIANPKLQDTREGLEDQETKVPHIQPNLKTQSLPTTPKIASPKLQEEPEKYTSGEHLVKCPPEMSKVSLFHQITDAQKELNPVNM
jgi:hypothetical protein